MNASSSNTTITELKLYQAGSKFLELTSIFVATGSVIFFPYLWITQGTFSFGNLFFLGAILFTCLSFFLHSSQRIPIWKINSSGIECYLEGDFLTPTFSFHWEQIERAENDIHPQTGKPCIYLKEIDQEFCQGKAHFIEGDLIPKPYVSDVLKCIQNFKQSTGKQFNNVS